MSVRAYYQLAKPGIIMGNAITAGGGFALAARGRIDLVLLMFLLVGLSLVIASACVFNNYLDRISDAKMARTKNRPLVRGIISLSHALVYGSVLGFLGVITLLLSTNLLTLAIVLTGVFFYLAVYTVCKYKTSWGTLLGSIAGAIPPVAGYTAVSSRLDAGAFAIFAIVVLWQMPHFFAIALYRLDDYVEAGIPVLHDSRGVHITKIRMALYVIAFAIAAPLPTLLGFTGKAYLIVALVSGVVWLWLAAKGFQRIDDKAWAKMMFRFSLIVITALCTMIPLDRMG